MNLHDRFSLISFERASDSERKTLCAELVEIIDDMSAGKGAFHERVHGVVAELKRLGHELYSFDEDDDFEAWCPSWVGEDGTGLCLYFVRDGVSRVQWSERKPQR